MLSMAKKKSEPKAVNPWPQRLRELQENLGLDNASMATHLDVSLHTYMAWKYGKRQPSALALRIIDEKLK